MTQPDSRASEEKLDEIKENLEDFRPSVERGSASGFEEVYVEHVSYLLECLEARAGEPVGWMDDCGDPDCYGLDPVGFRRIPEHPVECVCGRVIETWHPLYRHPHPDRGEVVAEGWVAEEDLWPYAKGGSDYIEVEKNRRMAGHDPLHAVPVRIVRVTPTSEETSVSELGDRLRKIRQRIVDGGTRLLTQEEIHEEVEKRRGHPTHPDASRTEDEDEG